MTRVLGISAFYHDSAAALVDDGCIIAAVQQERFTRKKHDASFPKEAITYCLSQSKCQLRDVDWVVFYEKPFLKFERLLETYVAFAPRGFTAFRTAMPLWLKEKLFQKDLLRRALEDIDPEFVGDSRLLFTEHHLSHAASAFLASPFDEAAILTMDGVGEWATSSLGVGRQSQIEIYREMHFPHSLGLLYSAFTYYTGFKVNSGEYKLMGLAPYGEPKYAQIILDKLVDLKSDGSFRLDLSYFDYCAGLRMTNDNFASLFGAPVRSPDEPLTQIHMDVAASIQTVTEEIVLRLARYAKEITGLRHLCLAGGVALNCVANAKVQKSKLFEAIWIQPAAGDAGGALGAALAGYYLFNSRPRNINGGDLMRGALLGPEFSQTEIERELADAGARFQVLTESELIGETARAIAAQSAVGWMQGRMEFGPRALGSRSILGDPRSPTMQKTLNLKVKYRESFRPFAPSVLREDLGEWFDLDSDSPYMLLVAPVLKRHRRQATSNESTLVGIERLNVPRSCIPAVTHIDFSARVQTVHANTNPRFHALIAQFKEITGCGMLVNTSFNVRGEPIVRTPGDAFRCFMGTDLDALAVGNCFLRKEDQDPTQQCDYSSTFQPD